MSGRDERDELSLIERDAPQFLEEGPSVTEWLTEHEVGRLEKAVKLYERYIVAVLRMSRPSHWICHESKDRTRYSLQGPGAEKMAIPLGINFEKPTITKTEGADETGSYYIYWCEGYAEWPRTGRRGWYFGSCDSRDQFFSAKPGWNPKLGEPDVRKSAFTNWQINAIARLVGLRDPDPALLEAAGIKLAEIEKPDYSGRKRPEDDVTVISEAQRKRLWAICKEQHVSEETLRIYLHDRHKFKSTSEITRGHYDKIVEWVQRGGQEEPK